jgi:hypothetical protein
MILFGVYRYSSGAIHSSNDLATDFDDYFVIIHDFTIVIVSLVKAKL